jgi:hypothetical protein
MGALFDFVAGEADSGHGSLVAGHIAACETCRTAVERLEAASFALAPYPRAEAPYDAQGGANSAALQVGSNFGSVPASLSQGNLREVLRAQLLGESGEDSGSGQIQPLSDAMDGACDAFESEWIAGSRPSVEEFLADAPAADQHSLLYELIRLELHYRRQTGEVPRRAEYLTRFPDFRETLDSIDFGEAEGSGAVPAEILPNDDTAEFGTQAQQTVRHEPEPLRYLGHFALLERIGSGGFGTVWRARDTKLNRIVAVKVPGKETLEPAELERFLNEAMSAARLRHPNIVAVHAVNADPPVPYIVTDFVDGVSLREWLNAKRMSFQDAAYCCAKLGHALHHAHERGIVHRDIKPENVLVDSALEPHLADFGLAKQDHAAAVPETVGAVFGTPAYMSPEQARGEGAWATRSTDIYSLGALLYALLTGRPPFLGATSRDILRQVIHDDPKFPARDPKDNSAERPLDLETICLKALSKLPANRYVTAEEFALDLERFLRHEPIRARRITLLQRGRYWIRRNRLLTAALAVMLMLGLTLALRPATRRAVTVLTRSRVLVTTQPAGATVSLVPLRADGSPDADRLIRSASKTPFEVDLDAGDYLVVAAVENHGFHEVYRHIPRDGELPYGYYHHSSRYNSQGVLEWPVVEIRPEKEVLEGMARFAAGEHSVVKADQSSTIRQVSAFYLDTTEFTIGELKRSGVVVPLPLQLRSNPPGDNVALSFVSYFDAVSLAEAMGKRLPDESEFQYAASAGGTQKFPWGETWKPELTAPRTSGPVQHPSFDRVDSIGQPPVFGLYSNVAEWTSSGWFSPNSVKPALEGPPLPVEPEALARKVWGWNLSASPKKVDASNVQLELFRGRAVNVKSCMPHLGFRCARSVAPRLRREDFATTPNTPVAGVTLNTIGHAERAAAGEHR